MPLACVIVGFPLQGPEFSFTVVRVGRRWFTVNRFAHSTLDCACLSSFQCCMFRTPATGRNKTKTPLSGGATGEDEVLQQKISNGYNNGVLKGI